MTDSHFFSRTTQIAIAVFLILLCACAPKLGAPSEGITNQFFREFGGQTIPEPKYDFSRLEKGYGLFVFSFESKQLVGDRTTGFDENKRSGLCIWEYLFRDMSGLAPVVISRDFAAVSKGNIGYLGLPDAWKTCINATFLAGRVVYGGRIEIELENNRLFPPEVTNKGEEDLAAFLKACPDSSLVLPIDTVLMLLGYPSR